MNERTVGAIERVVRALVERDYCGLARMTNGRRLDAEELERAVVEYGATLVFPPDLIRGLLAVRIRDRDPPTYAVTLDLWTIEEGRSDLSLELTVVDAPAAVVIEIDNLHVL